MISEEVQKTIQEQLDKRLSFLVQNFETKVHNRLKRMENRLEDLNDKFGDAIMATYDTMDELKKSLKHELIQEREDKLLINQFTNSFLAECNMEETISPVDFAFTRFSINVAVFSEFEPPEKMVSLPSFLSSVIQSTQDTVVGPTLLALVHLSLHDSLVPLIMDKNPSSVIIHHLNTSKSSLVLIQAAKLLASLAIHHPNKVPLSSSGCVQALLTIVEDKQRIEVTLDVKHMALKALCNITEHSATNKNLLVEIGGIASILQLIHEDDHAGCLLAGIKVLINCVYGSEFNASTFFQHRGDHVFENIVDSTDLSSSTELFEMMLICATNVANSQVNQIHLGSSHLIEQVIHILRFSKSPVVVKQAAMTLAAVCNSNQQNKVVLSSKGSVTALCHQSWDHAYQGNDDATIWCNYALYSILLLKSAQTEFCDSGGLQAFIQMTMELSEPRLLVSCIRVLSAIVPNPEDMIRLHQENTPIPIERVASKESIKRVIKWAYDGQESPPSWLAQMSALLNSTDEELEEFEYQPLKEAVRLIDMKKEVNFPIYTEHHVTENPDLKGLIFSFY